MKESTIEHIQTQIGHQFNDMALLNCALTHSSYANEAKTHIDSNQRLEYLGDAVLGLVIAEALYKRFKDTSEGQLTKYRAKLVCEKSLVQIAKKWGLGKGILLGQGEKKSHGEERSSTLADATEAVIAAVYLDAGLDAARRVILKSFEHWLTNPEGNWIPDDYKTQLQERVQQHADQRVRYELIEQKTSEQQLIFTSQVFIGEKAYGSGSAKSKKASQQKAAQNTLTMLNAGSVCDE